MHDARRVGDARPVRGWFVHERLEPFGPEATPDAVTPDAVTPDAVTPDAATLDAATPDAPEPLATVRFERGQAPRTMHWHMARGRRLGDVGQRLLAFYLAEMHARRAYQELGCSSTVHYAETWLDLRPRRTRELIAVGSALDSLPAIDAAFAEGRLPWSRVLLLVRVVSSVNEAAWLQRALDLPWRQFEILVRTSRPGAAPREPGQRKGLPEIRFPLGLTVDALGKHTWELVRAKFGAERGAELADNEVLSALMELALQTEEDGTIPGRTRVSASLYRVVLRPEVGGQVPDPPLAVDTEFGPLPIEGDDAHSRGRAQALCCDGRVQHDAAAAAAGAADAGDAPAAGAGAAEEARGQARPDIKTPAALRWRVMGRDGLRCRHCGSRHGLHVHHIVHRAHGGPTCASNLATLCVRCHGLVHAGLLLPRHAPRDAGAAPGHTVTWHAPDEAGLASALDAASPALRIEPCRDPLPPYLFLDDLPEEVDAAWWTRHAGAFRARGTDVFDLRPGFVPSTPAAWADAVGSPVPVAEFRRPVDPEVGPPQHTLVLGAEGAEARAAVRRVAARLGGRLFEVDSTRLRDVGALVQVLGGLRDGDLVCFERIQGMRPRVQRWLGWAVCRQWMGLTVRCQREHRTLRLTLPRITAIVPAVSDFGLAESLQHFRKERVPSA